MDIFFSFVLLSLYQYKGINVYSSSLTNKLRKGIFPNNLPETPGFYLGAVTVNNQYLYSEYLLKKINHTLDIANARIILSLHYHLQKIEFVFLVGGLPLKLTHS